MHRSSKRTGLSAGVIMIATLAFTAAPALAQVTGRTVSGRTRVEGTVADHNGKPLAGVIIQIANTDTTSKSTKVKTKKTGKFSHPLVEYGSYKIFPEKEGYKVVSYQLENHASDGTDVGSYGPVRFQLAQQPRTAALQASGICTLTIVMAPSADYQRLAIEAAQGSTEGKEDEGAAKVTRKRHPAEVGRELFSLRNYEGALAKFTEALDVEGGDEDPNLRFAIARCQYELGQYDEASRSLQTVSEMEKTPRAGLFYYRALIASKQGRTQEAISFLETEVESSAAPQASMLVTLGSLYREVGDSEKAIAVLERGVALDAGNLNALMVLGSLYGEMGDKDKAEAYFQRAVEAGASAGESGATVFFNLGALNYNDQNFRTAAEAYERAISLRPSYPAAHRELAYTYKDLGELAKARTHFQKYLDLTPNAKDGEEIRALISVLPAS